jgi:hypothetical protein
MWSDAVVAAESGATPLLAYEMGRVAETINRTIGPPNDEMRMSFLHKTWANSMVRQRSAPTLTSSNGLLANLLPQL